MNDARSLPPWAEDLRRRYRRGEASMFVLHGNVYDAVVHGRDTSSLVDFLTDVLLRDTRETIAVYNMATGPRFSKRAKDARGADEVLGDTHKDKVLPAFERLLVGSMRTAVIFEYAEALAPAGDPAFQADADRAAIIMLHRWSSLPAIEKGDNIVLLVAENLSDLAAKIVSNPKVAVVEVPMPDRAARRAVARIANPGLTEQDADRYAEVTAGLKAVQIASILSPPPASEAEAAQREAFIAGILGPGPDVPPRAKTLAAMTAGMSQEDIRRLIAPGAPASGPDTAAADRARQDVDRLIARRKREILERECFGLVEFVEPEHGFDVVGGMEEVKKDLRVVAENIRDGRASRVPMGILFTGPMGTGKTFVAEAFARECGLTTIKLKNFRSKWVGATEGNLEKILSVIKAIGQVVVIVDEGDRAFGSTESEGDGGTSSRVIARIKEFMSDTSNRGRILFLVMTNRPDKLDVDLKRAGRLDRKIPFLYSQSAEEVEQVARAVIRKNRIATDVDIASIRGTFSARLVGYSNADVEAVVLMANDDAAREAGGEATVEGRHFERAAADYFPSRDAELLEYMELLAVFEASSRRLLPPKYASMTPEELDLRLRTLRLAVGSRR
ncbi:MAG TPA: AAA family ATPase [Vicinamibacterales bacterium]|nr:AAA family ATPase [Vicinamibacterales bacterium]HPW20051.1 AAA family ATPase [Vicinamibacterales bacterium]